LVHSFHASQAEDNRMAFLNVIMLGALAGIAIPVIIHLIHQRTQRFEEWGAMMFLRESVVTRSKWIRLEELLLLLVRILLVAAVALAVARPFIPPLAPLAWEFTLPFLLAFLACAAAATIYSGRTRRRLALAATLLLIASFTTGWLAERWKLAQRLAAGATDTALIFDASDSMLTGPEGSRPFDRAVTEAIDWVERAGRGQAFSILLAGPAPWPVLFQPSHDRDEVLQRLRSLRPSGGHAHLPRAMQTAITALDQGIHPAKRILLYTDNQHSAWQPDSPAVWEQVASLIDALPTRPEFLVRRFDQSPSTRNIAITSLRFSRRVVGTDRPVEIMAEIFNSGQETITPGQLHLVVNDEPLGGQPVGALTPGAREVVRFAHRFKTPGPAIVRVTSDLVDDQPADNEATHTIQIEPRYGVLIVDGNPSARLMDQAGIFASLALRPEISTTADAAPLPESGIVPARIPITRLEEMPSLADYQVVILADTPRIPAAFRTALLSHVELGGGLIIAPGPRTQADAFNEWVREDGTPFLPARLSSFVTAEEADSPSINPRTLRHPALVLDGYGERLDWGSTRFQGWWKLEPTAEATIGARLDNGDALLVDHAIGEGRVVVLASPLDTRLGNWPTRRGFVPMVHQLVYESGASTRIPLHAEPEWEARLRIPAPLSSARGVQGLLGEYFSDRRMRKPVFQRIDPSIEFSWGGGSPAPGVPSDNFSARWSGWLMPPFTQKFYLRAEADDKALLIVDGKRHQHGSRHEFSPRPNGRYSLRLEFEELQGDASVRLFWSTDSMGEQIVPKEAFQPAGSLMSRNPSAEIAEGIGPDQQPISFRLEGDERHSRVTILGPGSPGVYSFIVPEKYRDRFHGSLDNEHKAVFSMGRHADESDVRRIDDGQWRFMASSLRAVLLAGPEDLARLGREGGTGREVSAWFLAAAGALLLLEIVLARWITLRRAPGIDPREMATTPGAGV